MIKKGKKRAPRLRPKSVPLSRTSKFAPKNASLGAKRTTQTVHHSEPLFTVPVSTGLDDFMIWQFNVNAGLPNTCRWLSDIANRYERYKFKSLRFHYEPSCPATTTGTVAMAWDFDVLDDAPEDLDDAMTYGQAVRTNAFNPLTMVPDLKNGDPDRSKFTRAGTVGRTHDLKTYDVGVLYVMTLGVPVTISPGFITIEYTVELFVPQIAEPPGGSLCSTAGIAPTNLVGTDATQDPEAVLPGRVVNGVFQFERDFEGLVNIIADGVTLAGDLSGSTLTNGSLTHMGTAVNGDADQAVGVMRLRARIGSLFVPKIASAVSIASSVLSFASARYNGF